ncbi:hypothetical protein DAPPUDRAFT_110198 [Daphnia pulex]|uniref:Uncharacterized protein n=1 Tax=Daphnia pulex TaxID=6669 RepID=E9H5T0_DAPPU|nr:hypothetical protein DAPPUDRAFT_110198 [Daphnia pulex]|eukprot:EFX73032.1 hypothetical protein DAPPUDRAFT_110198 [Daphnia pulex]
MMVAIIMTTLRSSIPSKEPYFDAVGTQSELNGDEFPYGLSRNKVTSIYPAVLPLVNQHRYMPENNQRILINLASYTKHFKVKTITFVSVTSLTTIQTQKCIPEIEFAYGSTSVTCGRKRRAIVRSLDDKSEGIQSAIHPSDVQPMEPTDLSTLELRTRENRQIVSSKEEDALDEEQWSSVTPQSNHFRQKRFFVHFVATTTSISSTLFSTTTTKTVYLLGTIANRQLVCLPDGYAVCSSSYSSPTPS